MTQKTNQFNLRTKRYTISEIQRINKVRNNQVILVDLKDLYGDHGIVGLIIVKELDSKNLFLDTFLISCRVFGRYLETWMIHLVKKLYVKSKYKKIIAEFIPTQKNVPCKDFLENHNFKKINKKNNRSIISFGAEIKNIDNKMINVYD